MSAAVPTTYVANAGLTTQLEQTSKILTDYEAARAIDKEETFDYRAIKTHITALSNHLPQTDEFRVVYRTCDFALDEII